MLKKLYKKIKSSIEDNDKAKAIKSEKNSNDNTIKFERGSKEEIDYEWISREEGYSVEDLKRGYSIFPIGSGIEVVQRLDCLETYGLSKFENDTEAGKQALKDGIELFRVEEEHLEEWYILDTPKVRKAVIKFVNS